MHKLDELVEYLQRDCYKINVETQGTLAPEWLRKVDLVTVSPKPPSSGEKFDFDRLVAVLGKARQAIIKIVIFDDADYEWAKELHLRGAIQTFPLFLSVGTDPGGASLEEIRCKILDRYEWLAAKVVADPDLTEVAVLPQLHVLLWGHKLGV
jgi:7-carboxy-7-deazaguanine synthase